MALKNAVARAGYGVLFCIALPWLLIRWARATTDIVQLPVYGNRPLGIALAAAGVSLCVAGVFALWRKGGGLPMNAFPPPRLVVSGVYRWIPHPIYTGFCIACFGAAMAAGSASVLWLIAPALVLACAALVWGYEIPDLADRFGAEAVKQLRRLPVATDQGPDVRDAVRFFCWRCSPGRPFTKSAPP